MRTANPPTTLTLAYEAKEPTRHKNMTFDSDSYPILVDSGASYCITNNIKDFIDTPIDRGRKIKGYTNIETKTLTGTIRWDIEDNNARVHTFIIPNTSYDKNAEMRILSPQHLAQAKHDLKGTSSTTYGDKTVLRWDNKQYMKTFPICPIGTRNVGIMMSAGGNKRFLSKNIKTRNSRTNNSLYLYNHN